MNTRRIFVEANLATKAGGCSRCRTRVEAQDAGREARGRGGAGERARGGSARLAA